MSLQSANNRLLISLNGIGTASFDPRAAVAAFLRSKQRRFKEAQSETFQQRPFVKKFFRDSNTFTNM
jgi:hypothetical protein